MLAATAGAGCAGSGVVITDGVNCGTWLDGNGRDAYLTAHNLKEYDAGATGRHPRTASIASALTDICTDNHDLVIDEALRLAAERVDAPPTPAPKPARRGAR